MRRALAVLFVLALTACAAQKSAAPASEAPASPASTAMPASGYPTGGLPAVPAPGATAATTPADPRFTATEDLERGQRELDVAAGDCRNACRALGSMDRAAGRLCVLAKGQPCDDAKTRVYSARDRVKQTCGQCDGGPSVDRNDPIPSLR